MRQNAGALCRGSCASSLYNAFYTVFKDVDALTRSISITNQAEHAIYLTKVMSVSQNLDRQDVKMLSLHGSPRRSLITYVQVLNRPNCRSRRIRIPGLDPSKRYMLEGSGTVYWGIRFKMREKYPEKRRTFMSKAVKLADIAARLDVSAVTVSKALSGQKGVSEEMREKIKKLAEELGYRHPSAQRREKGAGGYNIGVLIAELYLDKYDSFYWQMYQQVATKAVSRHCFTLMETVSIRMEEELELPRLIREQKADGLIIIGRLSERYLNLLDRKAGIPLIYLDFCNEKQEADAVISDSYYGAYRLTNYLFEMGHTKIAYVGTLLATGSITDRYFGYMRSLLEHGQQVRDDWILKDRDVSCGMVVDERLMRLPSEMPTAFLCNCDLTASILVKKLKAEGYRVPEDVSVAGYDNYLFPGLCDVAVTTYEVDMKEMAKKAIQTLVQKISGEKYRRGICIVEGHLVIKDSVKKTD